jgi:hypothetical protein
MAETSAEDVQPDPSAEATAEEWVHDKIAEEREAERPIDEAMFKAEDEAIERQEDTLGLNGLIGRIRALFRRS